MKRILKPNENIRKLLEFTPLQYMIDSIEENTKLAELYINECENTCLLLFGHYLFVAGEVTDEATNFLYYEILTEKVKKELEIIIVFFPDETWKDAMINLFPDKNNLCEKSLYRVKPTCICDSFAKQTTNIRRITTELLNSNVNNIDMIIDEVIGTGTYNSMDDFTQRGISFSPVIDNKVCGFCTSEYPTKSEIAIGIEVLEQYQKQGIAKQMTKMFLSEAAKQNLTVNWECWKYNIASANTAKSCGFEKVADYPVIFIDL
ncbi:GNAT family N-acetyltransferase [Sedimentibacter sp. zth1]|uniref:GNAT family N-acetyltransferase n=1 Tax=Sedimentibacter sp. zth1 TaxID=2816908 RepID=UPI001A92574A|nr:GNAT family N-acetyltransferase [Sedimentibacter sp. zth1]QSX06279.1 GNAT family N-acetyltransferase [Sedimentibacter sp. zth1]